MKTTHRRIAVAFALALMLCLALSGCNQNLGPRPDAQMDLTVYFANWSVHDDPTKTLENLDWTKFTTINHAFWDIVPTQELEDAYANEINADVWKVNGGTPYTLRSVEPEADFGGTLSSGQAYEGHFASYKKLSAQYPDVNIMISVGGWTRSGMFSAMAATPESRKIFIDSCLETLKKYPWIDGIDLDWEYPAHGDNRDHEGDPSNQGCPASVDDPDNYTALLNEMRAAFDEKYGTGSQRKRLTICCQASGYSVTGGGQLPGVVSAYQVSKFIESVDRINIMTYDYAGSWTTTNHHTNPYPFYLYDTDENGSTIWWPPLVGQFSTEEAVLYWYDKSPYPEKFNIGFASYARAWKMDIGNTVDKASFDAAKQGDDLSFLMGQVGTAFEDESAFYYQLCEFEEAAKSGNGDGWLYWFDEETMAPILVNNNPNSEYYGNFYSYDNPLSLAEKAKFIERFKLGGIILWATYSDAADEHSLTNEMSDLLAGITPHVKTIFDATGGKFNSTYTKEVGSDIEIPEDPTRKGYIFKGWYTQETGGTLVSPETKVTQSVTYYAQWEEEEPTEPTEQPAE